MINWYEMPGALEGFESNPAYQEKLAIDAHIEPDKSVMPANEQAFCRSDCLCLKKHKHKKKRVRRFLTVNSDMVYSKFQGMRCSPANEYKANKHFARDDLWKYYRNRHYDHRYLDRKYIRIKGTDGFSKQDKVYYRRLFRRSLWKRNFEMPAKGNFYKKTMWWDRFWY